MLNSLPLIEPAFVPPLDPNFRPAVLANRAFRRAVRESGAGVRLVLGLERMNGSLSRFETVVFPDDHPQAGANLVYAERLVKFLLWQKGGWKVYVGGPRQIGDYIRAVLRAGRRAGIRLPVHGRKSLPAAVHRGKLRGGRGSVRTRARQIPGPPSGRLPHRL